MDERVAIGYLSRPKGVHGWVVADPLTDDPQRFGSLTDVVVESDRQPPRPVRIEAWRSEGRSVLLKFAGIDSPEAVRAQLVKGYVTIPRDAVATLPPGQYYIFDLIGCQVVSTGPGAAPGSDIRLGAVIEVLHMPSADVIVVRRPGGHEAMVPLVEAFVENIDTEGRRIRVRGVEELFAD